MEKKYYSQHEEEKYIVSYFESINKPTGRLIDVGAFHPTALSNSRALIELGWEAVLVEPSPKCFKSLYEFYKDDEKVQLSNIAIGPIIGKLKFYDSGGGVATAAEIHYDRWKTHQLDYEEILVDCVTWEFFYHMYPGIYDFISIDAEGMDYSILSQIDPNVTQTKLICIENTYNYQDIIEYLKEYNFTKLIYYSGENTIMGKE